MEPDAMGFIYPKADASKCINCGLCEKVCSFSPSYDKTFNIEPTTYAARHKNIREVERSQSGAAFVAISDWILQQGGVVYGAGYEEHFSVCHKRATSVDQREEMRGSKYVQSNLKDIFKQVKTDLREGKKVLFTGTPCQVAGLASFIGSKQRESLYLMDIVCHGVPAPKIWSEYLAYIEKKKKKPIVAVNFRDKGLKGWRSYIESFRLANANIIYAHTYSDMFYKNLDLRYSCGKCPFTNLVRPADITVADCWGIEKSCAARLGEDNKGCSRIMTNTKKGKYLFEQIKNSLDYMVIANEDCLQPQLMQPAILNPQRAQYEQDFALHGFEYVIKKYGDNMTIVQFLQKVKRKLKRILKH